MAKGRRGKDQKILNKEQADALLKVPDVRWPTGHRNRVILETLLYTGLRLGELLNLKWKDIDFQSDWVYVTRAKWNGTRDIPLTAELKEALLNWQARQKKELGYNPQHVFTAMGRGAAGKPLQQRYIQKMLARYLGKAGINMPVSPHNLRHTYATWMYEKYGDLYLVQELLGHKQITTTTVYAKLNKERVHRLGRALSLADFAPKEEAQNV